MAGPTRARPPRWLQDALTADPVRFVDVGARGGWQRKWRAYDDLVQFVGFEPEPVECARLQAAAKPNERFVAKALYSAVGEVTLYVCDPPSRTSIYRPDAAAMARLFGDGAATRVVAEERLPVTTLDLALDELGLREVDFLKLDTQGSELDILRGGEAILAGPTLGLELEVEFVAVYEKQPLFPDISAFLGERDYELTDFLRLYSAEWIRFGHRGARGYRGVGDFVANWASLLRARGALRGGQRVIYADAVFLRHPEAWLARVGGRGDAARGQALRGFMSACIMGFYNHAGELAARLRDAGLVTADELGSLDGFLDRASRVWSRAADDAARAARRLVHRLQHLGTGDR